MWVGTIKGVEVFLLSNGKPYRHYTTDDGLPDNGIASITCDAEGNLWIATYQGLSKERNGKFENFYASDGLCGNEFLNNAGTLSADGNTLLLGGVDGISWFNPRMLKRIPWKANVYLTDFTVNNESRQPKDGHWRLSYADNSFTVSLSTLTFTDAPSITYLYRLNDETWSQLPTGSNVIFFSHLLPGNYKLSVKAMKNGQYTPEKTFFIHVAAPWYRSTIAYLIYILIIVLLFLDYRRRVREKTKARLAMQEHIHAEQLGEAKLKAFINISHEIRTPMTLIMAPLEQLLKEDSDQHRRSVYRTIRRNADRILRLINQLMDIRKIDKGQMAMRMMETDMVGFVEDICRTFQALADNKHILLEFRHNDPELKVWVDRSNFDKVVVNLFSNAFKFTPTGGHVVISLSHDDKDMYLRVYDDGENIPEEKIKLIFDRFYQVPTSVNDNNVGTGIGLDLTRSIVELHYGTIEVHNEQKGCTFTVTLPLGKNHLRPSEIVEDTQADSPSEDTMNVMEEEKPELTITPTDSDRKETTIIVAEDDDEIAAYLKAQLSDDYAVETYPNGKAALEACLQNPPQLVISDVMMPVMDGNAFTARLKANVRTNDIPVILLTAKNRDEDKLEGLETGADAYIQKPFNLDILRRVIVNLLNSRRVIRNKVAGNEMQSDKVKTVEMENVNDQLMQRIMDVINKHLNNSDINVDDIASEAGVSRVQLYRKMKEITNQTPHTFIRNLRLDQSARLLRETDQNISDIMYACGFNNASSFSRIFKDTFGMTPTDYILKYRK